MGRMKNLQLLENCFADTQNIQDVAKLEAANSKLIRQNTRLQLEKNQLALQAKKQELCIGHLLKKLGDLTDLANDQRISFHGALHRQKETVASVLQELSKSQNEIIQLRNELKFEKAKPSMTPSGSEIHRIPPGDAEQDFSDDITVHRNNLMTVAQEEDAKILQNEVAHPRYSLTLEETHGRESLRNHQGRDDQLQANLPTNLLKRKSSGALVLRSIMQKDPQPPFVQEDMLEKIRFPRSGLQEADDMEVLRPPLSRQASSVRGSTQSPCKLFVPGEVTRSNSRPFAMDVVRMQGSS